jgi:hypothetical protein
MPAPPDAIYWNSRVNTTGVREVVSDTFRSARNMAFRYWRQFCNWVSQPRTSVLVSCHSQVKLTMIYHRYSQKNTDHLRGGYNCFRPGHDRCYDLWLWASGYCCWYAHCADLLRTGCLYRMTVPGSFAAILQSVLFGGFTPAGSFFAWMTAVAMTGALIKLAVILAAIVVALFGASFGFNCHLARQGLSPPHNGPKKREGSKGRF